MALKAVAPQFTSLLSKVDGNLELYGIWTRRFVLKQQSKAFRFTGETPLDDAERSRCLVRAEDLVFLREKSQVLHLLKTKYSPKKKTRQEELIREAAAVGMKLPMTGAERREYNKQKEEAAKE